MILFFDTETSGLSADTDCILQLSMVAEEDGGKSRVLLDSYFRPPAHILRAGWRNAEFIHHISPDMVRGCRYFSYYRSRIQRYIDSADLIVGYNLPFDVGFLWAAGIVFPDGLRCFDLMREFAPVYGQWSDAFGDYKWQKLTVCADYYGYSWQGSAHGALADTLATQFCYHRFQGDF